MAIGVTRFERRVGRVFEAHQCPIPGGPANVQYVAGLEDSTHPTKTEMKESSSNPLARERLEQRIEINISAAENDPDPQAANVERSVINRRDGEGA